MEGTADPKLDIKVADEIILAILTGALLVPQLHKDVEIDDIHRYLSEMLEGFIVHTPNYQS